MQSEENPPLSLATHNRSPFPKPHCPSQQISRTTKPSPPFILHPYIRLSFPLLPFFQTIISHFPSTCHIPSFFHAYIQLSFTPPPFFLQYKHTDTPTFSQFSQTCPQRDPLPTPLHVCPQTNPFCIHLH